MKHTAQLFPCAFLFVVAGIFFLDNHLSFAVERFLRDGSSFGHSTASIPDLLLPFVLTMSASLLVVRRARIRRFGEDAYSAFCLLGATVLPFSFLIKTVLKPLFGRIETRVWLGNPLPPALQWFHQSDGHSGFPSGHMMVLSALAFAFWLYFPKPGGKCLLLLPLMGAALIITNYHFLTDVVAGAYLGLAVTSATTLLLEENAPRRKQCKDC
ncbi:MAG: phosphatase PAP2 family protein [Syntrophorhabdaceae bacterium]|nr:phosphatase PAP2 family protein [Syntrophorhabdaceae bacterium]